MLKITDFLKGPIRRLKKVQITYLTSKFYFLTTFNLTPCVVTLRFITTYCLEPNLDQNQL